MAQTAGIRYYAATIDNYGECLTTASSACLSATGNVFGNYGCFYSGNKRDPFPCLIGTLDECPTCSTSSDSLGVNSIDSALLSYMFGSAVLFWSIGLGIGLIIAQIRKTRI